MNNSMKIAICSVFTALSVVLLFMGGIIFVFVYIMPLVSGLFMIILRKTFGVSSAWITYTATSLLSLFLVNEKECMLMYILIFGYYPIIYPYIEKIKLKPIRLLIKLAVFNISICAVELLLVYAFHIPFLESGEGIAVIIVFAVLMNVLFIIYDFTIKQLTILYEKKFEKRIKKYLK